MPLAPHPETVRERRYCARRQAALARVKGNQGEFIDSALWEEIAALLPEKWDNSEVTRLLEKIEALDGSERSQQSLRDFIRELRPPATDPPPSEDITDAHQKPTEFLPPAYRRPPGLPARLPTQRTDQRLRPSLLRIALVVAVTLAGTFVIWKGILPTKSVSSSQQPANLASGHDAALTAAETSSTNRPFKVTAIYLGNEAIAGKNIFNPASIFNTEDKSIYAFVVSEGAAPSVKLHARWTYGDAGRIVNEGDASIFPNGPTITEFHISKPTPWPVGKYHVEISADGVSAGTKDFEVKK